jgi:hypothetical protein
VKQLSHGPSATLSNLAVHQALVGTEYCTFSTNYSSRVAESAEEKRFCVMSRSFGSGEEFCVTRS